MADVDVVVAGRHYKLSCRDGEEDHLRRLIAMVDRKAADLTRTLGDMTEGRTLLLSALLLADELNDLRARPPEPQPPPQPAQAESDPAYAVAVEQLAERMERLAARLEQAAE
jgi:cell division protein ZapA